MERPEPSSVATPSMRPLLLIGAGILALVAITVVIVLLAGARPVAVEPGSPEATLQAYLAAWEEGDLDAAHELFSAAVRDGWDADDLRRAADMHGFGHDGARARRVLVDGVDVDGDRARVHLTVEEFYGEGLSGDTYRSSREIRLVREQGEWRIDQALVWLEPAPTDLP